MAKTQGNKGEWSEIYVLFKLLGEGKLYNADENLNPKLDSFYPIIKIIRNELNQNREYVLNGSIQLIDGSNGLVLNEIATEQFLLKAKELFLLLKTSKGSSLDFPEIREFLNSIDINKLKADSKDKSDIKLVVHDLRTNRETEFGFSIKSMIGKNSTLFNPGAGTNFIYEIQIPEGVVFNANEFNQNTYSKTSAKGDSKIANRIKNIESLGGHLHFHSIQSNTLFLNLQLIDGSLPQVIAELLYHRFKTGVSKISDLVIYLNEKNPIGFDLGKGHPFYAYKINNFLTDCALGMTPEKVWTGLYDATGGIIYAKSNGEVVCYHIYNKKEFQHYLLNHTKLEQASTSEDENNPGNAEKDSSAKPYKYGWVYEDSGKYFIKLNLQIRFTD